MEKKIFRIVQFERGEGVVAIPENWISDDLKTAKWPNLKDNDIRIPLLISSARTPGPDWKTWALKRVFEERSKNIVLFKYK